MMRVVFDPRIVGEQLEVSLQMRFALLLCPQDHQTGDQAQACLERKIGAVEAFRRLRGIGTFRSGNDDGFAGSSQAAGVSSRDASSAFDWKAAYEALAIKFRRLEVEKEQLDEEVAGLQTEIKTLQKDEIDADEMNKTLKEEVTATKEERAALEVENRVLAMENEGLKAKTRSVRESLLSLQHQLEGEESDGEGYGTPRTTASKSAKETSQMKTKEPFQFSFQGNHKAAVHTPPATPDGYSAALISSVTPPRHLEGGREEHKSDAVRRPLSGGGACSPTRRGYGDTSSSGSSDTKKVPFGFRVRVKARDSG